jgi:hypothetical protein
MIKKILWVSGSLAAIAVLIRGSVVLGLFLGVLPGLILAVAPTIFLYTAAFALLRNVLRRVDRRAPQRLPGRALARPRLRDRPALCPYAAALFRLQAGGDALPRNDSGTADH